jgi:hypothetical protein
MKIAMKWSRCVEFTLPNNKVIVVKVSGEKAEAAAAAKELVAALDAFHLANQYLRQQEKAQA